MTERPAPRPTERPAPRPTERPASAPTTRPAAPPEVRAPASTPAQAGATGREPSPRRRTWKQLGAIAACAAVLVVLFDPVTAIHRAVARRGLHGDRAARRAAVEALSHLDRDYRGASLANLDLSGLDLSGADLRGVDLSHANLSGTKLFAAEVHGASLDGAQLEGADLDQVQLGLARIEGASCDDGTRLPHAWQCKDARVERIP